MIISNSLEHHTPQFWILSDCQCEELYGAALECLERVDIRVYNAAARDLLAVNGACVDGNIVHIPADLVRQAVAATPHEYTVWGRDRKHEMCVALDRVHFGPGPTCTYFIDPKTGERRKAQRGDAGMVAKVCDA
jgi:trimethylamine--corrinoid protein Co-methyltransferase